MRRSGRGAWRRPGFSGNTSDFARGLEFSRPGTRSDLETVVNGDAVWLVYCLCKPETVYFAYGSKCFFSLFKVNKIYLLLHVLINLFMTFLACPCVGMG
jgi:hypothetical protein